MSPSVEERDEKLERYRHIEAMPIWSRGRCGHRAPGLLRTCTRRRGHGGPHVAHTVFGRVVAVWEADTRALTERAKKNAPPARRRAIRLRERSFLDAVKNHLPSSLEEVFLLVLFVGMVVFVIDWTLRMLG